MNKSILYRLIALMMVVFVTFVAIGCGSIGLAHDATFESDFENNQELDENIYVSSAELIFKGINTETNIVEFRKIGSSEVVSLEYDGTTIINDKYGQPMNIVQLQPGDMVNIAYNSMINKVGAIVLNPNTFMHSEINKYSISDNGQFFTIGDETYSINENTFIYSAGDLLTFDQLINHDNLTIQGEGHNIYSIRVDDGHGYLELKNEEALIGGWIEVGATLISQIMNDMLFTIPEGEYVVRLTNEGIEEYRDITISRNSITSLDLKDIEPVGPEKGVISFRVTPATADVYVDGSYVNTSYMIKFPVGIHEVTASASGYATVSQYFEVTGLDDVIEIDLTKEKNSTSVSGNTVNKNLYANIIVEAPAGVEVYEDNIYKGITPIGYAKTSGTHTLTLRKEGYKTTSYNIVVFDDGKDQTFSFPDLEIDREYGQYYGTNGVVSGNSINNNNNPNNNSVSGNTISGNSVSSNTLKSS